MAGISPTTGPSSSVASVLAIDSSGTSTSITRPTATGSGTDRRFRSKPDKAQIFRTKRWFFHPFWNPKTFKTTNAAPTLAICSVLTPSVCYGLLSSSVLGVQPNFPPAVLPWRARKRTWGARTARFSGRSRERTVHLFIFSLATV